MSRILAVEDEPAILAYYKRLFESWGHEFIGVATAKEAIARVQEEPKIDVLIVDLELKQGDLCGLKVLKYADRVVPIVISGHSLEEVASRVEPHLNPLQQGRDWFFFAKPLFVLVPQDRERLQVILEAAGRNNV